MCARDYPNYQRDLTPRRLQAGEYVSKGNTYLVPELNLPERRLHTKTSIWNDPKLRKVFEFETPDGEKIRVPVGSIVKCLSLPRD